MKMNEITFSREQFEELLAELIPQNARLHDRAEAQKRYFEMLLERFLPLDGKPFVTRNHFVASLKSRVHQHPDNFFYEGEFQGRSWDVLCVAEISPKDLVAYAIEELLRTWQDRPRESGWADSYREGKWAND